MTNQHVLDATVCIKLDISLWGGSRRLKPEDLSRDATRLLPDSELASLGTLKLIRSERLTTIARIKRRADLECRRICVRFLNGYATDAQNTAALAAQLDSFRENFDLAVRDFLDHYNEEIEAWIDSHPSWEYALRNGLPRQADLANRFRFNVCLYQLRPADTDPNSAAGRGLAAAAVALSQDLFGEIATAARVALKQSYIGSDAVTRKALRPIHNIWKKLNALRYLDARCVPIMDRIADVLGTIPMKGAITGVHLSALVGLLHVLADPEAMKAHGSGVFSTRKLAANGIMPLDNVQVDDGQAVAAPNGEPSPSLTELHKPHGHPSIAPRSLWFS